MKRKVLALCDLETAYAINFMEYINRKNTIPFEVHAFTSLDQLRIFVSSHQVEILLISENAMCREVGEWPINKLVILSEGIHNPDFGKYPSVYKYQSSSAVVREVLACYGETEENPDPECLLKPKMKTIGVYSPLGRCLKTSFALTLGQIAARSRAALYLNIEDDSGFESLFHTDFDRNLSDIIYYLRQGEKNLTARMASIVKPIGNLDFLPPAKEPLEERCITEEEWRILISSIREHSSYEMLIMDIGTGQGCLKELLEECDLIYMPVKNDGISMAKLEHFENMLKLWDCEALSERIRKIHLPVRGLPDSRDRYLEQLVYSELGEYTRSLLEQESV